MEILMKRTALFFLSLSFLLTSCQGNVFNDMANKDTAEAKYEEALKLTDKGLYDDAFTELSDISTSYPDFASSDNFKKTLAGVQAGQCGLNFINFIVGLTDATGSSPFLLLMQAFKGIGVNPQKCIDAVTTMGTLAQVEDDQLLFMAVLGMTKVGVYLRDRADRDGTGNLGDGTSDATFDACDATAAANRLTDDDLKQVITGLGLTLQNFALIGGSFSSSGAAGALQAMQAFCDDPLGDGTGAGQDGDALNCDITDPNSSDLDAQTLRTFRRILNSASFGVGACDVSELNPAAPGFCCPSLAFP